MVRDALLLACADWWGWGDSGGVAWVTLLLSRWPGVRQEAADGHYPPLHHLETAIGLGVRRTSGLGYRAPSSLDRYPLFRTFLWLIGGLRLNSLVGPLT